MAASHYASHSTITLSIYGEEYDFRVTRDGVLEVSTGAEAYRYAQPGGHLLGNRCIYVGAADIERAARSWAAQRRRMIREHGQYEY